MRLRKLAVICLATLALLAGLYEGLRFVLFHRIFEREAQVTEPLAVQKAGRDLSILCQTCREHPDWFKDESRFSPAWTPKSVLDLEPNWVNVTPNGARIEFGGGFHHFGYSLVPSSHPTANGPTDAWTLIFYSEDSQDRELGRFIVAPGDVLTEKEFVDRTMTDLDRRITAGHYFGLEPHDASVQRCNFAIKHGQIPRLQSAIRETAKRNSDAWRDVLLSYAIDYPADRTGATERLRQWATNKGDFSAWLMVAYAFHKLGEFSAAEEAVLLACNLPADDPAWSSWNARARGYSMCRHLFVAGRFETCSKLCESLLAYQGGGNYMASTYVALRDACKSAKSQSNVKPPSVGEADFDPFAGLDISILQRAKKPETKAVEP